MSEKDGGEGLANVTESGSLVIGHLGFQMVDMREAIRFQGAINAEFQRRTEELRKERDAALARVKAGAEGGRSQLPRGGKGS